MLAGSDVRVIFAGAHQVRVVAFAISAAQVEATALEPIDTEAVMQHKLEAAGTICDGKDHGAVWPAEASPASAAACQAPAQHPPIAYAA